MQHFWETRTKPFWRSYLKAIGRFPGNGLLPTNPFTHIFNTFFNFYFLQKCVHMFYIICNENFSRIHAKNIFQVYATKIYRKTLEEGLDHEHRLTAYGPSNMFSFQFWTTFFSVFPLTSKGNSAEMRRREERRIYRIINKRKNVPNPTNIKPNLKGTCLNLYRKQIIWAWYQAGCRKKLAGVFVWYQLLIIVLKPYFCSYKAFHCHYSHLKVTQLHHNA